MSTDLQFHQDLPEIKLPNTIKVESLSETISNKDDNVFGTIQTRKASLDDEKDCHTPTSPKHMIPKIVSCPPAPRKPTSLPSCKRKLDFFEATKKDEINTFFKVAEAINSNGSSKRRCIV
ncbi:hypothetical protein Leryth_007497 [Lithospermum erythrorhizon]|uniref:Uncharacterized protein n=1 Tax=Lithospermum erythrorhizon TaxID=34254 RepID=A0AAV3RNB2_LITER|nr:hypothetical protein Leryth_007497 [Lithospermum erythrorhizon]